METVTVSEKKNWVVREKNNNPSIDGVADIWTNNMIYHNDRSHFQQQSLGDSLFNIYSFVLFQFCTCECEKVLLRDILYNNKKKIYHIFYNYLIP